MDRPVHYRIEYEPVTQRPGRQQCLLSIIYANPLSRYYNRKIATVINVGNRMPLRLSECLGSGEFLSFNVFLRVSQMQVTVDIPLPLRRTWQIEGHLSQCMLDAIEVFAKNFVLSIYFLFHQVFAFSELWIVAFMINAGTGPRHNAVG